MVPEASIVQRATGASIFKLGAEDRVVRVPVETGVLRDGWIEVSGDIRPGEALVRRGPGRLTDGAVVRIVEDAAEATPPSIAGSAHAEGAGS